MLENLSFSYCENISQFSITARKLCSLTIKGCFSSELHKSIRLNLDLKSISTLDLDNWSLQYIMGETATTGLPPQLHALNVEFLKLSEFSFQNDVGTAAFVRLLCICPKLCKLEICFLVIN
ncbi:unnamed protein product [Cuscuta europaea]|uniref:Uncharacterized protein n=1 Tax=Cuscuta europaea TaxID=41803 RepID=A0A9P1A0D1_CUSEU|nr:unnamed protein product [Cuscuta europaea]